MMVSLHFGDVLRRRLHEAGENMLKIVPGLSRDDVAKVVEQFSDPIWSGDHGVGANIVANDRGVGALQKK